jgi:hypothetical protein
MICCPLPDAPALPPPLPKIGGLVVAGAAAVVSSPQFTLIILLSIDLLLFALYLAILFSS